MENFFRTLDFLTPSLGWGLAVSGILIVCAALIIMPFFETIGKAIGKLIPGWEPVVLGRLRITFDGRSSEVNVCQSQIKEIAERYGATVIGDNVGRLEFGDLPREAIDAMSQLPKPDGVSSNIELLSTRTVWRGVRR